MSWISWEFEQEQNEDEIEYIKCQPKIQFAPTEVEFLKFYDIIYDLSRAVHNFSNVRKRRKVLNMSRLCGKKIQIPLPKRGDGLKNQIFRLRNF